MSQDFFADLERQLVTATAERGRRLRRARTRRAATLSTILVALIAAGAGLAAAVTGSDGGTGTGAGHNAPAPAPITTTTARPAAPRSPHPAVAVLNGTPEPGLARGLATRLMQGGHLTIRTVTNAPTNHVDRTRIYYARGHAVTAVLEAMRQLGVRQRIVSAAPASLRAVAGADADVIIVVGADQIAPSRP
jgi:hypothetical protein